MVTLNAFALLAAAAVGQNDTVLLDFTAAWCQPCQQMKPALRQLQNLGYPVQAVDYDRQKDLVNRFQVTRVPTFVLVSGGREVSRVVGAVSAGQLAGMFASVRRPPTQGRVAAPAASAAPTTPTIQFTPDAPLPSALPSGPSAAGSFVSAPAGPAAPAAARGADVRLDTAPRSRPFTPAAPAAASKAANRASPRSSAEQRARNATVRLEVHDDRGIGFATGTIIDAHGSEALVLTCGHVFKQSRGQGKILIDTYYPGGPKQIAARMVAWEVTKHDVGLVSFRVSSPPPVVKLAPGKTYSKRDLVFTLGCSRGADPTLEMTRIASIDRYTGASNIEIVGQPVDGRSGGGLFNSEGELIGVCNAADPEDDEGIYAALPAIHDHLAMNGMTHLTGGGQLAAAPRPAPRDRQTTPARPATPASSPAADVASLPPASVSSVADVRPASIGSGANVEVIVVVRPADGGGAGRVLNIRRPSRQLLDQLQRESRPVPSSATPAAAVYSAGNLTPVIRGQDRR